MKKILFLSLVLSVFFAQASFSVEASKMSSDVRFSTAHDSYLKGIKDETRGDGIFRKSSGKAQRMYEHAEHYYSTAKFQYEQLGLENNLDVTKELAECEKVFRRVHVKTNDARRKAKNR